MIRDSPFSPFFFAVFGAMAKGALAICGEGVHGIAAVGGGFYCVLGAYGQSVTMHIGAINSGNMWPPARIERG